MKIYVDIDDVLCETAVSLCEMAAREFGRCVDYADVHEFDLQKVFSFSAEEMERFRILSHLPDALASFSVTPGAVEGVRALVSAGHDVDLVTGRPASSHVGTEAWLGKARLGDFTVSYVDKYDRSHVFWRGAGDPPTVPMKELRARGYDFAIDDSPLVLSKLADWSDTKVLVFNRPWNAEFTLASNMARVDGWADILAHVGNHEKSPQKRHLW